MRRNKVFDIRNEKASEFYLKKVPTLIGLDLINIFVQNIEFTYIDRFESDINFGI